MSSLQPIQAMNLDSVQQQAFVKFFNSLSEKPPTTVRLFDRNDYYSVHGVDATTAAREVFSSISNIKRMGVEPNKLDYLVLSKGNFEILIKKLLLVRRYRVEIYVAEGPVRNNDWVLKYKGSPGCLSQLEEVLGEGFGTTEEHTPSLMAVNIKTDAVTKGRLIGVACVSIGDYQLSVAEFTDDDLLTELETIVVQVAPSECLVPQSDSDDYKSLKKIMDRASITLTKLKKADFTTEGIIQDLNRLLKFKENQQQDANAFPETTKAVAMASLAAAFKYTSLLADSTNFTRFRLTNIQPDCFLHLDGAALQALNVLPELGDTSHSPSRSLLGLLDRCRTQQGKSSPGSGESRLRSRLEIPSSEQEPSAAKRALKMSLALDGPGPELRESPPRNKYSKALQVAQTPSGSINLRKDANTKSPGANAHCQLPLSSNAAGIVEALDLNDEDVEEVMEQAPWHVSKWLTVLLEQPLPDQQRLPQQHFSNNQSLPGPSNVQSRRQVCSGSETDSDFDDQFDRVDIESAALPVQGRIDRDIFDEEELYEPVQVMVGAVKQAMDDKVDRLLDVSDSYTWEEDFGSFKGALETFIGPSPGTIRDYDSPYDAFTDIWSKDIIDLIAGETNRYARMEINKKKSNGILKPLSRLHEWVDTDEDEVMIFFAVLMYMGIDTRTSPNEYWRSNDHLEMPKFKQLLTYNRFLLLNKFLHFVDNNVRQDSLSNEEYLFSAKLKKLSPIISYLRDKFSTLYYLDRAISIDESLTLHKGRLSCQTKRAKAGSGIKSYELCESRTGYMYKFQFQIHTSKGSGASTATALNVDLAEKSTQAVLDLLQGLENFGHCVTMDNFYNCPALARYLKSRHFDCLGTMRPNRRNVPEIISKFSNNVAKGSITACHCGDVSIVAWKDSKVVTMISTYHDSETYVGSKAGKVLVKPVCVRDYNSTMVGVDLKDQQLSMYLLERKRCEKWYIKIFKRLLNVSIYNAFIMYTSSLRRRGKLPMTHREFRYELAKSLAERHCSRQPEIIEQVGESTRLRRDVVHEPKYLSGRNNRKRCIICYKLGTRKAVHTQCITCNEHMCFENCWKEWHTVKVLRGQERGRKRSRNM